MDDIRRWFLEHEDGDFVVPPRDHPYSVVPPSSPSQTIIYTTKPRSLLAPLTDRDAASTYGVIGRCGLPSESDVHWLRRVADGFNLLFVGDADPPDLLVFSWLRSRMSLSFRGLNDTLLKECGVALGDHITIRHSPGEAAAMPLAVQCIPDWESLLGPDCTTLMKSGWKIETEALISFATVKPDVILEAIGS
jgi:hypothetical protein